jgi:NADH-quinone oxidoreductase subunit N
MIQNLLPLIVLAGAAVLNVLIVSFYRNRRLTATVSILGFLGAMSALPHAVRRLGSASDILRIDPLAFLFIGIICAGSILVTVLSYEYFKGSVTRTEEYYILLLLAALGSSVVCSAVHFVSFFLGLEILSVALYALIAYRYSQKISLEAATKYLVLASVSTAFLLFGAALVYAWSGDLSIHGMIPPELNIWVLAGLGLMVTGVGFKLGVVPFHMWIADIYEAAPAPVTAFIASVSKGAVLAFILRFFIPAGVLHGSALWKVLALISILSMVAGNLLALLQSKVRRILAYSSIAHFGYILTAFLTNGDIAVHAVAFYLLAYSITIIGCFGIIALLSGDGVEMNELEDFRGLLWQRPWLGGAFVAMLLSLAGIPLTAGFAGKFFILLAGVTSSEWILLITLILSSVLGLYYYLRIVITAGSPLSADPAAIPKPIPGRVSLPGGLVIVILAVFLVWLGAFPAKIMEWIQVHLHMFN